MPSLPRCCAAALLAMCGCTASSPFDATLTVHNPTARTYEGSGGALGVGLEIRVPGLQGGEALVVDPACAGRLCGQASVTDPGHCGVEPRRVAPGGDVLLHWDGRYFPRSSDPQGACLGPARAVTEERATITLCGRLLGDDVRAAPLVCEEQDLALTGENLELRLNAPGSQGAPPAPLPGG